MTLSSSIQRLSIAVGIVVAATTAHAQMVGFTDVFGGFESGLGGWAIETGDPDNDVISINLSTIGATEGSGSLAVELAPSFGRQITFAASTFDPVFNTFLQAGADPTRWSVDFDVTLTNDSWADVQGPGTFFEIGTVGNSDGGFDQRFMIVDAAVGQAGVYNASVPVTDLSYIGGSSFYSFGLNSNSDFTPGINGEGVTFYLDNVRLTFNGDPAVFVEDQLFSWETPDDPGTPGVNEQLEGWVDGFEVGTHIRSITSDSATDGSSALRIDTTKVPTGSPPNYFTWGSQFTLDASGEGDPSLQGEVTSFINRFNAADKIAIDVTAPEDQFPNSPGFLQTFLHIGDDSGLFYQVQLADLGLIGGETQTL